MKAVLTRLFGFILQPFEKGDAPYSYKTSSRTILLVMGVLFTFLSVGSLLASLGKGEYAGLLPAIVFFCVGVVCLVIGALGSDRAVANLWGNGSRRK